LLRLYPRDHRVVFAAEMVALFDEAVREQRRLGRGGSARFAIAELEGLLIGAAREWLAKLAYRVRHTNSYIDGRGLPDRLLMRPAGVSWEAYYSGGLRYGGFPEAKQAGSSGKPGAGACVNARQRFESGSSLVRLLLFTLGHSCQCAVRRQMEHGLDGSVQTREGSAN
jgi:hypothetical protein